MKATKSIPFLPALLACAVTAQADVSGNVALTTDYVWRGVSQSDEDMAVQGGFDYSHDSGLYAGVWGSNVDFDEGVDDPADMELDLYGGYATEIEGISADVGVIHYRYPGTDADLDWTEFYLSLGFDAFSASINYSNDVFNADEDGIYYSLGYGREIGSTGFSVSAHVGYYDFDNDLTGSGNPDSYTDWQLGVATTLAGLDLDLSYFDTDSDGEDLFGNWAEERLVLTVSKSL
ncbi:TorF family putative porin [Motiliproteus sp. SC1-56]|uniref:TorF family putative porin n=1 Tax=Motiliproteus sp. SC1-56 TaxID=2799565 RepID=UPI001A8C771A|nr:TorF family putative porin [Motiliproteus sp. SC1-56]